MNREQLVALVAVCGVLQPAAALDTAPLPARDLHAACIEYAQDPESESGRLCKVYVRGFIAGLKATRTAKVDAAQDRPETFSERALRTRLGVSAAERACSTTALSAESLIGQLLAHLAETPPPQDATASEVLAAVVERFQTCG